MAHVNDERQPCFLRKPDVPIEVVLLQIKRGIVPVSIQARFPQGDDSRLARQANDFIPVVRSRFSDIVRLHADRCTKRRVLPRQAHADRTGGGRDADGDDRFDADGRRPLDHCRAIFVELFLIEVAMGVEEHVGSVGHAAARLESESETESRREKLLPMTMFR